MNSQLPETLYFPASRILTKPLHDPNSPQHPCPQPCDRRCVQQINPKKQRKVPFVFFNENIKVLRSAHYRSVVLSFAFHR